MRLAIILLALALPVAADELANELAKDNPDPEQLNELFGFADVEWRPASPVTCDKELRVCWANGVEWDMAHSPLPSEVEWETRPQ